MDVPQGKQLGMQKAEKRSSENKIEEIFKKTIENNFSNG
jgi:hypothetical protein